MKHYLSSLVYVSESTIIRKFASSTVDSIVSSSTSRNRALSITGALIFTGDYFAQILEGSHNAIDELMASIERDSRHRNIRIVVRSPLAERRFPDWRMVYSGPSQFVSARLALALRETEAGALPRAAHRLVQLLEEFSKSHSVAAR